MAGAVERCTLCGGARSELTPQVLEHLEMEPVWHTTQSVADQVGRPLKTVYTVLKRLRDGNLIDHRLAERDVRRGHTVAEWRII